MADLPPSDAPSASSAPPPSDDSTMSPARRRAEARKQKILGQGGDRLAKITGAMKAGSGATDDIYDATPASKPPSNVASTSAPSAAAASPVAPRAAASPAAPKVASAAAPKPATVEDDTADPVEQVPSASPPASTIRQRRNAPSGSRTGFEPRFPANGFGPSSPGPSSLALADQLAGDAPPRAGQAPGFGGEENPMEAMMRMMGIPIPPPGSTGPSGAGTEGLEGFANNPFLKGLLERQQQAAANGGQPMPPAKEKTLVDRIFPLLHLVAVLGLAYYTISYFEPMSRSLGTSRQVDFVGWGGLAKGSEGEDAGMGVHGKKVGEVPLFWMFVTVELGLQAGRLFLSRFRPPPPMGLLSTLITFLPPPFSTLIATALSYLSLLSSLLDDFSILLFVVGALVVWGQWKGVETRTIWEAEQFNQQDTGGVAFSFGDLGAVE